MGHEASAVARESLLSGPLEPGTRAEDEPRAPLSASGDHGSVGDPPLTDATWRTQIGETAPAAADEPGRWPRLRGWVGANPAIVALGAMIAVYIGVFGALTWRQHANFGTFGFDMGIYDQGIWLLSRFNEPFVTVRGLDYFGHHVNPLTLLFVPAYWLGAGPHFLYLAQTVWLALGAVPIWLLARDRLGNPWVPLSLAAAFLLYPSVQWINWWHFHPDALIITPLLFAYWLASRRRWGWFWIATGAALLAKEDAALAVAMLGLLLLLRRQWRHGVAAAVLGAGWFLLATQVVIVWANEGLRPLYADLYPQFGHSVPEIASNIIRQPGMVLETATTPERLEYYTKLFAPVAFVPLLALPVLSIGAPQLLANVLSVHGYTHDIKFHYSAILVAAVFLATVEAVAIFRRRMPVAVLLAGLITVGAVAANVAWSPSPVSTNFRSGIWASPAAHHPDLRDALAMVPADAGVSATYYIVPHLTHREHIYEFPNPFVPANWGVAGSEPPAPAAADYLVLDTRLTGDHTALYEELVGGGEFVTIFERGDIVVAQRPVPRG